MNLFFDGIDAEVISNFLNERLYGSNLRLYKAVSIKNLEPNAISFISNHKYKDHAQQGGLVLVSKEFVIGGEAKNSYIKVENPRLAFAKIISKYFYRKKENCISGSSFVAENVYVGNNIYIGRNVIVEEGCYLGDNTIIGHNTVILKNSYIGRNCVIGPGVIIGDEGLSSLKDEQDNLIMLRHIGRVKIEDHVEIGAGSTIARGTLDDTVIGKHSKIGPQVNIGHNTVIGENCEIAGKAQTCGSVKIGRGCFLGSNCTVKDGISLDDYCVVGIGAIVVKNVLGKSKLMGLEAIKLKDLVKFKIKNDYR